ncbi:MAG: KUP/HAK/KT family potassium transporter [Alphaproteobacteria bacterium]|nr:KUP/HAK/KT family potassium transporter [Alphaproteobacteria bacterium]
MTALKQPLPPLLLGALGVVYGDIGTSPLYTLRECLSVADLAVNATNVLGILSLITWALLLVVTLKYVAIVLHVDNRGEGGILALTARATVLLEGRGRKVALAIGLLGCALFYADSLITPAISVLGAMEGLGVISPTLKPWIIPGALGLLLGLFAVQRHGTHAVGQWFGPIMLVWFSTLGLLGGFKLLEHPGVLAALNPQYALNFISIAPGLTLLVMGAVVLAVTGAEALYADMGHFGRRPIQYAWLYFVGPALLLNYYGQGALLLENSAALKNPFYLLAPEALRLPLVVLAAAATVIASQAVITGAYSLTQQAIQLGYLPRVPVLHTSENQAGQIYLPTLNRLMAVAVVLLVLGFQTSSNLAHAYGLAVTGAMLADTLLMFAIFWFLRPWARLAMFTLLAAFLLIESSFLAATALKIMHGGWFPLLLGGALFFLMHTWYIGRQRTQALTLRQTPTLDYFLKHLDTTLPKVRRTAVFLTSDLAHAPPALMYNLHHNGVWHTQNIIIKVARARIPRYPTSERIRITHHGHGVSTVHATYGFMETPDIPKLLTLLADYGLTIEHPERLSYFLSTHTYVPSQRQTLGPWQEGLFVFLDKLQQSAITYFHLPRGKVIEIGNQIEI